jgi:hypothetical protein
MKLYKTIPKGMISKGKHEWKLGEWYEVKGELELCKNGFHASKLLSDAFSYVSPYWVCEVETGEEVIVGDDKVVARRMRVINKYLWTKKDSVTFAVWFARRCLKNYEKEFPNDRRPREAIIGVERWLRSPTKKNKELVRSAESALSAAWLAARSAESAPSAAWLAARSASRSAESALSAAWLAARSASWLAARSEALSKEKKAQHRKILRIINKKVGDCDKRLSKNYLKRGVVGREVCWLWS